MNQSSGWIRWPLLITIFCLPFFSCLFPTEPSKEIVRTAVKLSQSDFPDLAGATEVRAGERPWLWEIGDDSGKFYVSNFNYHWKFSAHDFLTIDLFVTESREEASNFLTVLRNSNSLPEELRPQEDKPPLVGNISYGGGRYFIRDNIVVENRAYGNLREKTTAIAKQVDVLLRASRTASSANRFKPKIERFQIAQNPVLRGSTTQLIIQVTDPLGGIVFYEWRFSSSLGGIVTDEYGHYLYQAGYELGNEKLTLFAINQGGFLATAEIDIQIK